MIDEPDHHRRYRVAWDSFNDPDTPDECRDDLMKEMDNAQNHFGWDEFHTFKKTLKDYVKFWEGWKAEADKKVDDYKKREGLE